MSESFYSILVKTWLSFWIILNLLCKVNFCGSCSGSKSSISAKNFDCVASIINGSFEIIKNWSCWSSQYDCGHSILFFVSFKNDAFLWWNFFEIYFISETKLLRGWCSKFDDWSGTYCSCYSLQFKLWHNFNSHDFIFFKKVNCHFGHWSTADNNLNTCIC